MAVVIDEVVTESIAQPKPRSNPPPEPAPLEAPEVERILAELHARLARVRAH